MHDMKMWQSKWLVGLLVFGCVSYAQAIGNFKPTAAELSALPGFCAPRAQRYGNQSNHPEVKPWIAVYGQDWIHLHHYCSGLNFINQSYRGGNSRDTQNLLQNAVRELNYTLKNVRPDTGLSAEILMARGQALLGLKSAADARKDLERAIAIDPKLRRAYGFLADAYVALKQKDMALKIMSEGVRHNPDASSLKRRYDELGGTKPYPPAYVAAPPPEAEPLAVVSPSAVPADRQEATDPVSEGRAAEASPSAAPPVSGTTDIQPPIGSPTNPWCRFCP